MGVSIVKFTADRPRSEAEVAIAMRILAGPKLCWVSNARIMGASLSIIR